MFKINDPNDNSDDLFSGVLPPSTETIDENKGIKVITEYKYNEDGKTVKVSNPV